MSESTKRTIEPADLFRFDYIQDGALSPDGSRVAYTLYHADAEKEQERTAIYIADVATGEARQFTCGLYRDGNPRWSPDGKQIAFVSVRGGPPQIYIMPSDGGEPRALTSAKKGVGAGPLWSPDGKTIAFTTGSDNPPRDPTKPYRITRRGYRMDGAGYVDDVIQGIHVIPAAGGEARRLVQTDYHQAPVAWSPDGREILFNALFFPDSTSPFPHLRIVSLKGEVRELVEDMTLNGNAAWTPDGKHIAFVGQPKANAIGCKNDLWVTDPHGATRVCRTSSLKGWVGGSAQPDMPVLASKTAYILPARSSTAVFLGYQEGGTVGILRVDLSGPEHLQPVLTGDRSCFLLDADDRHLLVLVSDLNNPAELYVSDLDGTNERRLTHINDGRLAEVALPSTERLLFPSTDGVQVEAWLMKPPVGDPPYPTILYTHGGPTSAFGYVFSFDFQMLAGAGYAVLFVNYRGSCGYGDEFSTSLNEKWGGQDYADSMAAVDYAVARGLVDPDRLGCTGLSYGGYMSSWIVGQTDRFKASVVENPVTNLVTLFGVSDVPDLFVQYMGGTPWEVPDRYRRSSPITYAHKCKTPTLLIQGEMDLRCPTEQSEQFYATLKATGCTVEMLRLPNSSHIGAIAGPIAGRKAQNEALLGWMNRYVLGRT